jgi:hypothetical protein
MHQTSALPRSKALPVAKVRKTVAPDGSIIHWHLSVYEEQVTIQKITKQGISFPIELVDPEVRRAAHIDFMHEFIHREA